MEKTRKDKIWEKPKLTRLEGDVADGKDGKPTESGGGGGRGPS